LWCCCVVVVLLYCGVVVVANCCCKFYDRSDLFCFLNFWSG
jgi:hypothetical protein